MFSAHSPVFVVQSFIGDYDILYSEQFFLGVWDILVLGERLEYSGRASVLRATILYLLCSVCLLLEIHLDYVVLYLLFGFFVKAF